MLKKHTQKKTKHNYNLRCRLLRKQLILRFNILVNFKSKHEKILIVLKGTHWKNLFSLKTYKLGPLKGCIDNLYFL